ncbi:MAG: putative lactoylglutathione lyase [Candidatus Kaiserbacteria bacterium]|nr:putative lactoylglutathione lyase [Candidatus Kaiserbacteria bacterium]
MIEHTGVQVKDVDSAKEFYQKVLGTLGYKMNMDMGDAAGFMEGGHTSFWIGKDASPKGIHVAFRAESKEAVDTFYSVAISAGGTDNGAPGYRTDYSPGYYAAFILDADKNNIEAVWFDPSKEK